LDDTQIKFKFPARNKRFFSSPNYLEHLMCEATKTHPSGAL